LTEEELEKVTAAAIEISNTFEATRDATGNPRPWDIEFGFANGQLWLLQARPFVGNEEIQNLPALAPLDVAATPKRQSISLDDVVQ